MDDFFDLVHQVVRQIPPGRVSSYGAIARYLCSGLSARTGGWAMNAVHQVDPAGPAHRVVNRIGMLSGQHHFEGPGHMQALLEAEGIQVVDHRVQKFDELFWDPSVELRL